MSSDQEVSIVHQAKARLAGLCLTWMAAAAALLLGLAGWPATTQAQSASQTSIVSPSDGDVFHSHDDITVTARIYGNWVPYAHHADLFIDDELVQRISLANMVSGDYVYLVWSDATAGPHTIKVSWIFSDVAIPSDPVSITVRDREIRPLLGANPPALEFKPGVEVTLPIKAVDETNAVVSGASLSWTSTALKFQAGKATCTDQDAPKQGSLTTDAGGNATLRFVPGCASGNRRIVVTGSPHTLELILRGPDDRAGAVTLKSGAAVIVVTPGTPSEVPFVVKDVQDHPIGGSTLDFSLDPATAGSLDAAARVDDQGNASTQLSLNDSAIAATLTACVRNRPGLCVQVPVRSSKGAIADPASRIVGPMVQQTLDAPLAQFDNIGKHLSMQRNGRGWGFSNEAAVLAGNGSVAGSGGDKDESKVSVFVGGNLDLGKRDSRSGARDGLDATTRGLTVGVDVRAAPAWVIGAAIGGLRAHTEVGDGMKQHASGLSGSLYAQWLPSEHAYINAALNIGNEDFDVMRPACGNGMHTETSGDHRALSIEAGYAFARNAFRFTPYLRYQHVNASLDAFNEPASCVDALHVDATSMRRSALVAGASIDRVFSARSGVWIPSLGVEYTSQSQQIDAIFARLLAGGPSVSVPLSKPDQRFALARFSLSWTTSIKAQPLSAFFGFDTDIGRSDYDSRTFMLGLRIPF